MRIRRRDVRPGTDGLAAKYYEDEIGNVLTRTVDKRLKASNTSEAHRAAIPVSAEAWRPIASIIDKAADAAIAAADADAAAASRERGEGRGERGERGRESGDNDAAKARSRGNRQGLQRQGGGGGGGPRAFEAGSGSLVAKPGAGTERAGVLAAVARCVPGIVCVPARGKVSCLLCVAVLGGHTKTVPSNVNLNQRVRASERDAGRRRGGRRRRRWGRRGAARCHTRL